MISNPWVSPNAQRFGIVSFGRVSIPAPPNIYPVTRPDYATFFKGLDYECVGTTVQIEIRAQYQLRFGDYMYDAGMKLSSHQHEIWEAAQYGSDIFGAWWEARQFRA